MKKIEITLRDELLEKLERQMAEANRDCSELLKWDMEEMIIVYLATYADRIDKLNEEG